MMNWEQVYEKETGKDPYSHCVNCGRHSAYTQDFLVWCVNRERKNCIRSARERAVSYEKSGEHHHADSLRRLADEIEGIEEYTI